MPLAVDDIFLVTFKGECANQTILNTFYYRIDELGTAPLPTDYQAQTILADALTAGGADILQTPFINCMPQNYTLSEVWVQKVFPARYRKYVEAEAAEGTIAADALATNLAAVVSRFGIQANRHNIGSLHVGPIPTGSTWQVDGQITSTYKALLITLGSAMLEVVDLLGSNKIKWVPVLFAATGTPVHNDIVTTVAQDTVRTMRRRTVGLGI